MKQKVAPQWYPYALVFGAVGTLIITIIGLYSVLQKTPTSVITQDVQELKRIFETIDRDCTIIDFEETRTPINFLTVERFIGSSVGGMNMRNPKNWKGPYIADNPTIQEKHYVILNHPQGLFIIPDNGVRLSSGAIIGTDIIFSDSFNIDELLNNGMLEDGGKPFVAKIVRAGHNTRFISADREES
jgi:hypothetical protein